MTAAAVTFSVMNVVIRVLAETLDPLQIGFFRCSVALLFMLPWLLRTGRAGLRTTRLPLHFWRAALGLCAMTCWFYAIALLPLAEAVSLNFTVPLFATAGAAVILGEVVRARRWSATIVGFLGVLIIVRPGFAELSPAMALPILAAVCMAGSTLLVKILSKEDRPATIVIYMNLILTPLSLIPALFVWRWPDPAAWGWILALGLLGTLSHLGITRAYAKADASAILPFSYARLPLVALIAYFAFDEIPDHWTWIGAGVIVGSAIYIARRETRLAIDSTAGRTPQAQT
jgi:drug/metabolite transporter (DMT)-like permease